MGRNYSRKDNPVASDLSLVWDNANSDWKLASFSGIATLMSSLLTKLKTALQEKTSEYSSPVAGFSHTLTGTADVHLILTPAATLATGTIVLPQSTNLRDKQLVLVTSSAEITSLTVSPNGASLVGTPTTISAGGYFEMKYDSKNHTWYRVG